MTSFWPLKSSLLAILLICAHQCTGKATKTKGKTGGLDAQKAKEVHKAVSQLLEHKIGQKLKEAAKEVKHAVDNALGKHLNNAHHILKHKDEFELEGFPDAVEEVKNSEDDGSLSDDNEVSGSKDDEGDGDVADEEGDTLAPMDVPLIPVENKESPKHVTKHTKPEPPHKSEKKKQKDKKKVTKAKHLKKEKHTKHSKLKLKRKKTKHNKQKHQEHHKHHNHRHKDKKNEDDDADAFNVNKLFPPKKHDWNKFDPNAHPWIGTQYSDSKQAKPWFIRPAGMANIRVVDKSNSVTKIGTVKVRDICFSRMSFSRGN
ncbi:Hypothetical predicted protein [Paramuricea clavata]|uniref:Uncharacterized protein n=1 Tax=Paramuricea clavata TaxID=317549 RepID=A0A7D9H7I0_PARCT|nr:Hypothetical predicted protein [Paramuricea clavata]